MKPLAELAALSNGAKQALYVIISDNLGRNDAIALIDAFEAALPAPAAEAAPAS